MKSKKNEKRNDRKPDRPPREEFLTYHDEIHGFQLQYPREWSRMDNYPHAVVVFMKPGGKLLKKEFSDNVSIVYQDLSFANLELRTFTESSIDELQSKIPGFELLSMGETTVAGMPAFELIYTGDYKKKQRLMWRQFLVNQAGVFYLITCSAIQDRFDVFWETAGKMVESFNWVESAPESEEDADSSDTLE